ncbi:MULTISPECIES: SDR family NAD(P)-dependent oxidoreductase [unclassified Pseudofrankia]|uniref:SDR family NAD(P)-dependent oxidoreductase n=1 Tax=unclassified Pseudofrankia TaxID=2994372 RepID=UPI0008D9555D|nr:MULTISPECIES: SDR family NAD(P)-dependent oxidoreductase [unclassified Pseudofrankia]MDT3445023.1 SDR family NAD(P)-dependent oxidoreductase [Pseudofrankia sp. BMG5.37]OHV47207.1 hypothetical protein BCD48_19330 [Pseudofrankia sp. BMG5.36]
MEQQKVIVITGANGGIGAAAARELARQGHRLALVGLERADTERIAAELGATAYTADFSSFAQVRELGRRLLADLPRIDVLVNNAGMMSGTRHAVTEDGNEWTLQVNHLAPFLLTQLLAPRLAEWDGRVVVTASLMSSSRLARFDPERLSNGRRYRALDAYAASKLANIAFAAEMPARIGAVRAVSFHPGIVRTNFGAEGPMFVRTFMRSPFRAFLRSPEQAADTLVWLATVDGTRLIDGAYYFDRRPARPNPLVYDARFRRTLWRRTSELVNAPGLHAPMVEAAPANTTQLNAVPVNAMPAAASLTDAARLEATRLEATRLEAVRVDAARLEAARLEAVCAALAAVRQRAGEPASLTAGALRG